MQKVETTLGTAKFGEFLHLATAYQQPCDNFRQFMSATWCSYCHHELTQH